MTVRSRSVTLGLLAAAVGLGTAAPGPAAEPGRLEVAPDRALTPCLPPTANERIAQTIAEHLRQSGNLRRYVIDVTFHNGAADLSGLVADQPQREEALRIVQAVPGVERVRDHLTLVSATGITQALAPPLPVEPGPLPQKDPVAPVAPLAPEAGGVAGEPMPIFQAPPVPPYALNPPRMPPYAWPTYAPYNNYSRVAYPQLYPYQSWPFMGPMYPFPKVPLGWRSVKVTWKDGYWWYGKTATGHDWWRVRYH